MKSCTDSQYFIHVSLSVAHARSVMLLYHLETLPAPDPPPLNPQRNLHMEGRQLPQPCVSISCADFLDRVVFSFFQKDAVKGQKQPRVVTPFPAPMQLVLHEQLCQRLLLPQPPHLLWHVEPCPIEDRLCQGCLWVSPLAAFGT